MALKLSLRNRGKLYEAFGGKFLTSLLMSILYYEKGKDFLPFDDIEKIRHNEKEFDCVYLQDVNMKEKKYCFIILGGSEHQYSVSYYKTIYYE